MFGKLYDEDVCSENSFREWSASNEEPLGKGKEENKTIFGVMNFDFLIVFLFLSFR